MATSYGIWETQDTQFSDPSRHLCPEKPRCWAYPRMCASRNEISGSTSLRYSKWGEKDFKCLVTKTSVVAVKKIGYAISRRIFNTSRGHLCRTLRSAMHCSSFVSYIVSSSPSSTALLIARKEILQGMLALPILRILPGRHLRKGTKFMMTLT